MPKIKIFLLQPFHNALPLGGTLQNRVINIDSACPLCLDDIESVDYLLKYCVIVKKVWEAAN